MGKPVEIFMPVVDGSLRDYSSTRMEKKEVTLVFKQMMAALKYLHGQKIVHGDIKPENILYENRPAGLIFLLADFGYAERIHSNITRVGTQIYLAPEVWDDTQLGFELDIWSLGVVIYEMSTGSIFTQLSGLTDRTMEPKDWCKRLENACRTGGDLSKMVIADINNRATVDHTFTFSNVPDNLPSVSTLPSLFTSSPTLTLRNRGIIRKPTANCRPGAET